MILNKTEIYRTLKQFAKFVTIKNQFDKNKLLTISRENRILRFYMSADYVTLIKKIDYWEDDDSKEFVVRTSVRALLDAVKNVTTNYFSLLRFWKTDTTDNRIVIIDDSDYCCEIAMFAGDFISYKFLN